MGLNLKQQNSFDALVQGASTEIVEGAWGGWHDAGDWDRRAQHLRTASHLLLLLELRPKLKQLMLGMPESGDAIPDLIDEALWTIDLFGRLQKQDGGVPGGIESAGHPLFGESSWSESQALYVYAPDPWASWLFTAAAARASRLLSGISPERSKQLAEKAMAAMNWAEANRGDIEKARYQPRRARNLAALELFRMTSDPSYHELFVQTSNYASQGKLRVNDQQFEAGFVYAHLLKGGDRALAERARAEIFKRADFLAIAAEYRLWANSRPLQALWLQLYVNRCSRCRRYFDLCRRLVAIVALSASDHWRNPVRAWRQS